MISGKRFVKKYFEIVQKGEYRISLADLTQPADADYARGTQLLSAQMKEIYSNPLGHGSPNVYQNIFPI